MRAELLEKTKAALTNIATIQSLDPAITAMAAVLDQEAMRPSKNLPPDFCMLLLSNVVHRPDDRQLRRATYHMLTGQVVQHALATTSTGNATLSYYGPT